MNSSSSQRISLVLMSPPVLSCRQNINSGVIKTWCAVLLGWTVSRLWINPAGFVLILFSLTYPPSSLHAVEEAVAPVPRALAAIFYYL